MGIQGLLPLLKDIQVSTSISSFSGQTVGIDAYCWLHKGGWSCAKDIVLGNPTKVYVNYIMRRVEMLISHNVTPILIFDGGHLPAKAETEKTRRLSKKKYKAIGMNALKEGNEKVAWENFQRCVDVTPEMASEVIQECYTLNVQCIVAPYEADAQLAYLMKEGITQLTISEDSDLLLYGCNRVMYKMSLEGEGLVIDLENLCNVKTVQLSSFTVEKFRHMCMLSGCDYLPSIKGMGLMKAFKSIRRYSNVFQCIKALKCNTSWSVAKDYEENFRKADLVFKYQLVFDIRTKKLVRLNDLNELDNFGDVEKSFAGPMLDESLGIQIALGNLDPITGKTLASLKNFASGIIKQTVGKSNGWDRLQPNTATSFGFRDISKKTVDNSKRVNTPQDIGSSTQTSGKTSSLYFETSNTPAHTLNSSVEACKSLKRLMENDISTPSREEKIRKLYGEDEKAEKGPVAESNSRILGTVVDDNASDDLLFTQPKLKKHHRLFTKKCCTFKSKFSSLKDDEPEKVVVSRFFSSQVAKGKENVEVLEADTPSPVQAQVNGSPKKGSFLNYLDNVNVRGYEATQPLSLSQSSSKKIVNMSKTTPQIKSKRNNMFLVKKNVLDLSPIVPNKKPSSPNLIKIQSNTLEDKNDLNEESDSKKESVVIKPNESEESQAKNLSRLCLKPKASIYQGMKCKENRELDKNDQNPEKVFEVKVNDHVTPEESKKTKKMNGKDLLIHFGFKPKASTGQEIEAKENTNHKNRKDLNDLAKDHEEAIDSVLIMGENGDTKPIHQRDTVTDLSNESPRPAHDVDVTGSLEDEPSHELDEEPLPLLHIGKNYSLSSLNDKPYNSVEVIDLEEGEDEEAISTCSHRSEGVPIVKSLSSSNLTGTKCRPIGLSKKTKPLLSHNSCVGKQKQITFEKFAYKKKSF